MGLCNRVGDAFLHYSLRGPRAAPAACYLCTGLCIKKEENRRLPFPFQTHALSLRFPTAHQNTNNKNSTAAAIQPASTAGLPPRNLS